MTSLIETERLALRRMTEQDLDFLAGMLGDPEVMRHYPKPLERAEAADWLARVLASYQRSGYGFWLARLRESDEPVGQVGLLGREIEGQPEVEVAYMLARRFWGLGLATEAALACRDHALEVLGAPRVVSMIRPENQSSLKVAARLGMVRIGQTTHVGLPHDLYAYPVRR